MKTFCFSEVVDAEWKGGTIHAQLSAFPRPSGLTKEWAAPPKLTLTGSRHKALMQQENRTTGEESDFEWVDDCCVIRASDGILIASIDLLNESGESPRRFYLRPNSGGQLMFERLYDYAIVGRPFSLNLQLS